MPLPSDTVGSSTDAFTHEIDARWTMAYAASIDDLAPCYLDTRRSGGVVAHPLFPVCIEWPVVLAARRLVDGGQLSPGERARGVHASHDLVVHRLIRPGDVLTTTGTVVAVERRSPGAYEVLRLDTVDSEGGPVATTHMGSLFLGVDVDGADRPIDRSIDRPAVPGSVTDLAAPPLDERSSRTARNIAANLGHTYTECARIWNPIHTDAQVAEAAGLPGPILHGTATLAIAVSTVVHSRASGDPARVDRIAGRFAAMVMMPSTVEVRVGAGAASGPGTSLVAFEVLEAGGGRAVRDGSVELGPPVPKT